MYTTTLESLVKAGSGSVAHSSLSGLSHPLPPKAVGPALTSPTWQPAVSIRTVCGEHNGRHTIVGSHLPSVDSRAAEKGHLSSQASSKLPTSLSVNNTLNPSLSFPTSTLSSAPCPIYPPLSWACLHTPSLGNFSTPLNHRDHPFSSSHLAASFSSRTRRPRNQLSSSPLHYSSTSVFGDPVRLSTDKTSHCHHLLSSRQHPFWSIPSIHLIRISLPNCITALSHPDVQPAPTMDQQQQPPPTGGVPGPAGRRLHIAHRRSPSELTPLMSMFSNPGSKLLPPFAPYSLSSGALVAWRRHRRCRSSS